MRWHEWFWLAFITPSPASITPYQSLQSLAANVPNNISRNSPFYSFAPFLVVSVIYFISNLKSSGDLTIFIISSISLFEIINAVVANP